MSGSLDRGSKSDKRDFRGDTQAHWHPDCAEAAIHVQGSMSLGPFGGDLRSRRGAGAKGQTIQSGNEVCHEARRAKGVVHNFDLYLPAMCMTRKA